MRTFSLVVVLSGSVSQALLFDTVHDLPWDVECCSRSFGDTADIDGDVAVVSGDDVEKAYVYERDPLTDEWSQVAVLSDPDATSFGRDVRVEGNTVVVAALLVGTPEIPGGGIYVYYKDAGGPSNWGEVARITPLDPDSGYQFADDIGISGDTVVATALGHQGNCPPENPFCYSGAAYVFERDAGGPDNWGQVAMLLASDLQQNIADERRYGSEIAIDGDTVVVSATRSGKRNHLYIYERNHGGQDNWGEVIMIENDHLYRSFGSALAIEGDVLAVSDDYKAATPQVGRVRIYERNAGGPSAWGQTALVESPQQVPDDSFSEYVSLKDGYLAVSAPGRDDQCFPQTETCNSGMVFLFERITGTNVWMPVSALTARSLHPEDDLFGRGMALGSGRIVVGAPKVDLFDDDCCSDGAAYVLSYSGADCNMNGINDACEIDCLISPECAVPGCGQADDCNGNLRPDTCDLQSGLSEDCNQNGFPDECEPAGTSDCNANGTIDLCEIHAGTSEDCNGDAVLDECELGPCCIDGTTCTTDTLYDTCISAGGIFLGPCAECPTQNGAVFFEEHNEIFVHVIGPPVQCGHDPPAARRGGCPPAEYIDPWESPADGAMCHNFGVTGSPAIPADFFDPGSDPFTGFVCLEGVPLGPTPYGDFGVADTLISRSADPFDRCALPSPADVTVDIEVVELSLVGTAPITVTYNGGQNPEFWEVTMVDLSPTATPPLGSLTATKTHCNGGTYTSQLHVQPRFTFTKVSDPTETRALDTGSTGAAPITLSQATPADWVHDIHPSLGITSDGCSVFHGGITDANPTTSCDCDGNLQRDVCDIEGCAPGDPACRDCNANTLLDTCDLSGGAADCDGNGVPDECDPDCDGDGTPDACETGSGAVDCNGNGVPDVCDIGTVSDDCDLNGVPDECQPDCSGDGIPDACEFDCDGDGTPDQCELVGGAPDCNSNGLPDECEADCDGDGLIDACAIAGGAPDCDGNGVPDTCDPDCDGDGTIDACEIAGGAADCDANGVPDNCDPDCDGDGLIDACAIAGGAPDCNTNGIPDSCDPDCDADGLPDDCAIAGGASDCNGNGIPDDCELAGGAPDCNENGMLDSCDIASGEPDCNGNGSPDSCDIASGGSPDDNGDGIPDECTSTLTPPMPAFPPHDRKKNRYISFNPNNPFDFVEMRVTLTESLFHPLAVGQTMWVDEPDPDGIALLSPLPVTRMWPESVIHVTGCFISPVATYEVRASNGLESSIPLTVETIDQPVDKYWGDTVGNFNGIEWTPPQGSVNIDDAVAVIKTWQVELGAPHISVTDVEPQFINKQVNFNDVLAVIFGFQGEPYDFGCDFDPCFDNSVLPCF